MQDALFVGGIAFFHIFWYFYQVIWKLFGSEVENCVERRHIHASVLAHVM